MKSVIFVFLLALAPCMAVASVAEERIPKFELPAIAFPAYHPECGDGHHIMDSRMTDMQGAFVLGSVDQSPNGYAVASFLITDPPVDPRVRVFGFFSIDRGAPTAVLMSLGRPEFIILPNLRRGKHEATTGTIYLYPDGHAEQKDAFNNCFTSEHP